MVGGTNGWWESKRCLEGTFATLVLSCHVLLPLFFFLTTCFLSFFFFFFVLPPCLNNEQLYTRENTCQTMQSRSHHTLRNSLHWKRHNAFNNSPSLQNDAQHNWAKFTAGSSSRKKPSIIYYNITLCSILSGYYV